MPVISRLNHAASVLAAYASSSALLHSHARLASGWWLAFAGRESNSLDSIERFQSIAANVLLSQVLPGATVDIPCAKPGELQVRRVCWSMPTAQKRTSRSAFSDTHHSWQVAVSEGGTCTRGLRISRPKRPTFTALLSSPRVCLRSTTNTQGSPSHRLTILPSQNASVHVPGRQFITSGGMT